MNIQLSRAESDYLKSLINCEGCKLQSFISFGWAGFEDENQLIAELSRKLNGNWLDRGDLSFLQSAISKAISDYPLSTPEEDIDRAETLSKQFDSEWEVQNENSR